MAPIAASGQVSFSDLRAEFVGGSDQISMSDLYRGGSNILAKAGDNTAVNLAANVPTSGEIVVADFYSTAKGFKKTFSAGATNQSVAGIFGDDEDVNYPKFIDIDSGVTIGGTGGTAALTIGASLAGSLTINNSGTIVGTGGAANSGAGGNAISCGASGVTLNNLSGSILAGGGGGGGRGGNGGSGGTGGGGSYTTTNTETPNDYNSYYWYRYSSGSIQIRWYPNYPYGGNVSGNSVSAGGYTYYKGNAVYNQEDDTLYRVSRSSTTTTNTNGGSGGSGGSGGNGGVGQGYSQAAASGAAGSSGSGGASGGTNAGSGGTGGTGGAGGAGASYGTSGSSGNNGATGSSGSNGNRTNGSAGSGGASGSSGGAAGAAVAGTSITINNSGNVYGATA